MPRELIFPVIKEHGLIFFFNLKKLSDAFFWKASEHGVIAFEVFLEGSLLLNLTYMEMPAYIIILRST